MKTMERLCKISTMLISSLLAVGSLVGCASRPRTYDRVFMKPPSGQAAQTSNYVIRGPTDGRYNGREFIIDPERIVIAIDLDDCVIDTEYRVAVFTRYDKVSQPMADARETIEALANDFQIIYISARPWFYYPGTRWWLDRHGFPPAPIVHSTRLWYLVRQQYFKKMLLKEMQQKIPNLLIGIGDRATDIVAYRSNKMVAINVTSHPRIDTGHDAIFVSDWKSVDRIFEENRDVLTKPDSVHAVLKGELLLKLPLFRNLP